MYHSISAEATPQFRPFAIAPVHFAEQMAYLHQHGYTPLTVSQFVRMRSTQVSELPQRPVVITFDDGFADFFTNALPVLQYYDFSATLYIASGYINGTSRWLSHENETTRPMLTWEQLREISTYGIECGAHSHRHAQLDILPSELVWDEIVRSKTTIEEQLGQPVQSFAYPYGYFTRAVRSLVQQAGFTSACAVQFAMSRVSTDVFALKRLIVKPETSIELFAALLCGDHTSLCASMYLRTRTQLWQVARRCSAALTRSYRGGHV
ncbi:MAG TPA: polysaccharide deacetylase family protein [Dictyobacter sp.]|jgi:peptidoglycan/xylan/chitin deacetylase (PgdA/CDA1 family)|nr:polysaccharide deacetylase family protein [Dictyobacter sp.]